MQEDFLHYIWKFKKFKILNLKTTSHQDVEILNLGEHNHNSGPDFFNAKLKIAGQLWAGNVEIHIKSSDWYVHNHEQDDAYNNVILHVVWEDDAQIFRKDNTVIPTLELKSYIQTQTLTNYKKLSTKKSTFLKCEKDITSVSEFSLNNWLERLYFERLERKSQEIENMLESSKNDWEDVLFKLLAKNFGLKINGDAFLSTAYAVPFSVLRKESDKLISIEALLFGQSNLLNSDCQDTYYQQLQTEYNYLKQKHQLKEGGDIKVQFFRLRPINFPTIRIAQLAQLYHMQHSLFSKIINTTTTKELYDLFTVKASKYWNDHYNFGKTSRHHIKKTTTSFIDLLLINTIIPLIFTYSKVVKNDENEKVMTLIEAIKPEKNSIINLFNEKGVTIKTALDSQAILQLKNQYCTKNKCLQCVIGSAILNRNM